jgi:hypothetical protein
MIDYKTILLTLRRFNQTMIDYKTILLTLRRFLHILVLVIQSYIEVL